MDEDRISKRMLHCKRKWKRVTEKPKKDGSKIKEV
jgi:hypothetical protein